MANENQNEAARNAEAQRRAAEQRSAQQGQNTGVAGQQGSQQQTDPGRRAVEEANRTRRASFDAEKKQVAERPQQVGDEGQKPTPTQQENDEIRAGLRHIDDKEDDGSGPDFVHNRVVRRLEPGETKGKYETR